MEATTTLLWLSTAARDLLRSISKLLRGDVPCPASRLGVLFQDGDAASQCEGLLSDAKIRAEFAKKLSSSESPKEIADASAAGVVELFAAVLQEQLSAILTRAAVVAKDLPPKWETMNYEELTAKLAKGTHIGEALKRDWMVWHSVGHAYDAKLVPQLPTAVLKERLSILAACGEAGALTDFAVAKHVLEHLEQYTAWEASMPGSKPKNKAKPLGVLVAFDDNMSREVAVRRVLASAFPTEVATNAASEATGAAEVKGVLTRLAGRLRAEAVIPLYTAPNDPKPSKAGKVAEIGQAAKALGGQGGAPGEFKKFHESTATQELQWHLLRYKLCRTTLLSAAEPKLLGASGQATASSKVESQRGVKASKAPSPPGATTELQRPGGFGGVWAPTGGACSLPPGHTPYSWEHATAEGMGAGFPCTWSAVGTDMPPGHTPYSWEKVLAACAPGGAAKSSSSAGAARAPLPAVTNAKAEAKAPAQAKPNATAAPAPTSTGTQPAEGSPEAAFTKLDLRCGRISKCEKVPDSDKLYLLEVDIGDEKQRQVITGLQKHYCIEELRGRKVVVYCNIKPGKLAGYESQAMVLAATKDKGTEAEVCKLLDPPEGASEGTRPMCGSLEIGCNSATQSVKHVSKFWNQVMPLFLANDKGEAAFGGTPLTMGGAVITTGSLTIAPIS